MVDRLFLSHLSSTGKVAYFVGQIVAILGVAILVFGVWGMGMREGELPLIIGALATIVIWGPTCMAIWPEEPEGSVDAEEFDDLSDL